MISCLLVFGYMGVIYVLFSDHKLNGDPKDMLAAKLWRLVPTAKGDVL